MAKRSSDDEKDVIYDNGNTRNKTFDLIINIIIFLPVFIVAFAFYSLLRFGRLKTSVIASIILIYELILLLIWNKTDALGQATSVFQNIGNFSEQWGNLIPMFLIIAGALGGILGLIFVVWENRQMKSNPHRLALEGNWQYKFKHRRTPIEYFKRKRKIEQLKNGTLKVKNATPLGIDLDFNEDEVVCRFQAESVKHTFLTGATGSGKTISLLSMIYNDIVNGGTSVVLDFKRSPEVAAKLAQWCHENDVEFYHFMNGDREKYDIKYSKGQSTYDPLSSGSTTSRADMLLGMREYDTASAVYKTDMQQLLQVLLAMLHYADKEKAKSIKWGEGGFYEIASALQGSNLTELAAACEGTPIQQSAEELEAESRNRNSGIRHSIIKLQGSIRTIIASNYGQWLKKTDDERTIDLFELTKTGGKVILFSFDSESEPDFAKYIGSIVLTDLTRTSSQRRNAGLKNLVQIYIDEFQSVNPSTVLSLLEKSRDAKMAMTLAQQSFDQIIAAAEKKGEAYLGLILDTCSNFIIHAGATEDSAIKLAKIVGKEDYTKYTSTSNNESFFMSVNFFNKRNQKVQTSVANDWVYSPSNFMKLSMPDETNNFVVTAVVINKKSADPKLRSYNRPIARTVWMIPNKKVTADYYEPRVFDESTVSNKTKSLTLAYNENEEPENIKQLEKENDEIFFETDESIDYSDDGEFIFEPIHDYSIVPDQITVELPELNEPKPSPPSKNNSTNKKLPFDEKFTKDFIPEVRESKPSPKKENVFTLPDIDV